MELEFHIFIIVMLLTILLFYKVNSIVESFENKNVPYELLSEYRTIIDGSSKIRERVQATKNEINSVLNIPQEDIDEILRNDILISQYIANYNNEKNPQLITLNSNYNENILKILEKISSEMDEGNIREFKGDKEKLREKIQEKINEDIENYGYRHEILPKKFMNNKYNELKDLHEDCINNNSCEAEITKVKEEYQGICEEKLKEKEKEITELEKKLIKKAEIERLVNLLRAKIKTLIITSSINRRNRRNFISNRAKMYIRKNISKRKNTSKKCGTRIKSKHPRHCGGRTIRSKHHCNRLYQTYKGEDLKCQWVRNRRSCDFWQPGKPYTKQKC